MSTAHDRVELRTAVLDYGDRLGWPTPQIIHFTEALTGCPWQRCRAPEFLAVLDEYLMILDVLAAKPRRHGTTEGGADGPPA